MGKFFTNSTLCKCVRTTRLYKSVYDVEPATLILPHGAVFYSNKQFLSDNVELFCISEGVDSNNVPIGYWCAATTLQVCPNNKVNENNDSVITQPNGAVTVDEELVVKGNIIKVYPKYNSEKSESNGLVIGDTIKCDQKVDVNINGLVETRYHIKQTFSEDQTVVGMWVVADRSILTKDGLKIQYHNPSIATLNANNITPYTPSGENTVENNPNKITTSDGTSVTIPNVEASGESTSDNIVVNRVNVNESMDALYDAYGFDYTSASDSSIMSIPIGQMLFVHGMPFQYTYITDRRDSTAYTSGYTGKSTSDMAAGAKASGSVDAYGRSFAKDIAANMPIVVLAPGRPKFLTSVKSGIGGYVSEALNDVKNTFMPMFSAQSDTEYGSILEGLNDIEGDYNYYSMEVDNSKYFKYVNSMCRTSARLMGLSDVKYRGVSCADFDWGTYNTAAEQDFSIFEQIMGLSAGVSFAFDPQSSVSDTISNTTGESQFMSFFNDLSSKARELEFITGYTGSGLNDIFDSTSYVQQATAQLNTGAFAGLQNVIDRISVWGQNTIHGMNIRFPEIWNDSSHSKSYDIDMHFIAPYSTAFCKWRYVLVPFFHIFALAAPKSDKNTSQYSSPFLIRAYSKGYFNVEMGIIESITWKRFGDGDMISEDGIPTQIDVSISFKDLYHTLSMTEFYDSGISNFMNNTGLMDLIGTLSGVNMNRISISERLALFASSGLSVFGSLGSNFMRDISTKVARISDRLHLFGV